MIAGIYGVVIKKTPNSIYIKCNSGLIYEVFISLNCIVEIDKFVELLTTHIFREDGQFLYGFSDINEKSMFDKLIKISGIGAKVAMAICSYFTPATFAKIIQTQDLNSLKKVVGVGAKGASRILVELGEFSVIEPISLPKEEAKLALETLGFNRETIIKVLSTCTSTKTEELIKEALKKIQSV